LLNDSIVTAHIPERKIKLIVKGIKPLLKRSVKSIRLQVHGLPNHHRGYCFIADIVGTNPGNIVLPAYGERDALNRPDLPGRKFSMNNQDAQMYICALG